MIADLGESEFSLRVYKKVFTSSTIPDGKVSVTSIARKVSKWFGHKCGAESVFFSDRFDHEFKEGMAICGNEGIGVHPVHFKLTVSVFVVVLICAPAEGEHGIADFTNDVIATHQGLLVVTGFSLAIESVGDLATVGTEEEVFALYTCFDPVAKVCGLLDRVFEDYSGGLSEEYSCNIVEIGGEPCNFGLPGELNQAIGVGDGEDVGVGGGEVEPCGESGEACTVGGHLVDAGGGDEFRSLGAEEVGEGDQEVFDVFFLGDLGEWGHVYLD